MYSDVECGCELNRAQADIARMTNTLKAVIEVNAPCWRGEVCELCAGVRAGLGQAAAHCQRHADVLDQRVCWYIFAGSH